MQKLIPYIVAIVVIVPIGLRAHAQVDFTGPVPYLSAADIPAGFYEGAPTIEDLEDGSLDFGLAASTGAVLAPQILTDSVDADDGFIDGLGNDGHSWSIFPASSVTFTFPAPLPTAAALVVTDTGGNGSTTISAFGPGMTPLGSVGPFQLNDGDDKGGTAEDRFFGVRHLDGILAITVSNTAQGVEVDHIQFGSAAAIFTGPVPYLSSADIPPGFYQGTPTIEDLEDGSLDFGLAASTGAVLAPQILTDSVDADDGFIDGLGNDGHSWSIFPASSVTFTFPAPLPTAAALVVTDSGGSGSTTVSFFGPGMALLGDLGPFQLGDGDDQGMTAEDRFFGARHAAGIMAITVSHTDQGIEVDHIQFERTASVPTASSWGVIVMVSMMTVLGVSILSKRLFERGV